MTDPKPYAKFDEMISMLRAEGHGQVAQRLQTLLHETAWTSGSELMGELGLEIVKFLSSNPILSPLLRGLTRQCMASVKKVWPGIEKVR